MDAQKKNQLITGGINVDAALARFMGNEAMLLKYLNRFLSEKSYAALAEAIKANDESAAQAAAHTLKSVCGTIGCEKMQSLVVAQEAAMRSGDWQKAVEMMPEVEAEYNTVCANLKTSL